MRSIAVLLTLLAALARGELAPVAPDLFVAVSSGGGSGGAGGGLSAGEPISTALNGFNIVINPGATLAANAPALAAFERAAASWEAVIADPIVVTVDADLRSFGAGNENVIGGALPAMLVGGYDEVRDAMVLDSAPFADEGIVGFLPTASQFTLFSNNAPDLLSYAGRLSLSKANAKALGFPDLDSQFGVSDGGIDFNSDFTFDFDRGDGVAPGAIDFESVALHELGHALGFLSEVDEIDRALAADEAEVIEPTTLDLFRFSTEAGFDPETLQEFTENGRVVGAGFPVAFDDLLFELAMSTGVELGDGRQASHWLDDGLSGLLLGTMDPTLASGQVFELSEADLRAMDLIGWDIVSVPEASVAWLALLGLALGWRRRVAR